MIPVKQWIIEEAERSNATTRAIEARVMRGRYEGHERVRIPGKGLWVVKSGVYKPVGRGNLKQFVIAEAMRYGVTIRAVYSRIYRGNYRGMVMQKAKGRIVKVVQPGRYETHYRRLCNKFVDRKASLIHADYGLKNDHDHTNAVV